MAGLLIVYIMVMTSNEGTYLDKMLGDDRCSAFIHVIECNLLMEEFCKSQTITRNEKNLFHRGIPYILETFKNVINQQEGSKMKFIKFHLPKHFALTMNDFGSLDNVNSALGERLHITETKNPTQTTQ